MQQLERSAHPAPRARSRSTAAAASPQAVARATRPCSFNDLPTEMLVLIATHAVAFDSLQSILSIRGLNRTCRDIIEGTYLHPFYRSLLAKWKVPAEPNVQARKYRTVFALVLRELRAGRCGTCRFRVDRGGAPVGGLCRVCRLDRLLALREKDPDAFDALPQRATVGYEAPYFPKDESRVAKPKPKPVRISRKMLLACLGLPLSLADRLEYTIPPAANGTGVGRMRHYKIPVVERIMAV
ncbi:hypothetical protein GGF32_007474 [Allomyces javanicus]|nr:hypothetical protein GGF32_007474 [Allomyces javanicus]